MSAWGLAIARIVSVMGEIHELEILSLCNRVHLFVSVVVILKIYL